MESVTKKIYVFKKVERGQILVTTDTGKKFHLSNGEFDMMKMRSGNYVFFVEHIETDRGHRFIDEKGFDFELQRRAV